MQVLYQLPPNMVVSSPMAQQQTQSFIMPQDMSQDGKQQYFTHGTQFFLPQQQQQNNSNNQATYMVVSNKEKSSTCVQGLSSGNPLKSPPSVGVSQILANINKTNLMSDIDNPNSKTKSHTNTVWVNRDQQVNRKGGNTAHFDPSRRPVVNTNDKGHHHQIHVHKVQHGNARVKYVEFKPVKDGNPSNIQNQGMHSQGGAGGPQNQFYGNPQHQHQHQQHQLQQQQQRLSVKTQHQQQSALSPLNSPPALRPPPNVTPHSRSIAMNSPPSLVPSPDVRPRFEYHQQQRMVVRSSGQGMMTYHNTNSPSRSPTVGVRMQKYSDGAAGTGSVSGTVMQAYRPMPDKIGKTFQQHNQGMMNIECLSFVIPAP